MLHLAVNTPGDYNLSVTAEGEQAVGLLALLIAMTILAALLFALITH